MELVSKGNNEKSLKTEFEYWKPVSELVLIVIYYDA